MKTFKKVISVILCMAAISGLCVTSAFAYKTGDVVTFVHSDGPTTDCYYVGEVSEGTTCIKVTEENKDRNIFYKFEAKKKGNYSFVNGGWEFFEFADSVMKEMDLEVTDYDLDFFFVYLEEGTYYIPTDFYGPSLFPENINVSIEFLGEFKDVSYDKEAFSDAILYADVDYFNNILKNAKPAINFTEKSLEWQRGNIYLENDPELKTGENTVTFEIMGHKFTETLEIVLAEEIIDTIEVVDIEKHIKREVYYDGEILDNYTEPEEIVVYFKDGTSKKVKKTDLHEDSDPEFVVEFPNGRVYTIYMDTYSDGIFVDFGGFQLVRKRAIKTDTTFAENFKHFLNNIFIYMATIDNFEWKISRIINEFKIFGSYVSNIFIIV